MMTPFGYPILVSLMVFNHQKIFHVRKTETYEPSKTNIEDAPPGQGAQNYRPCPRGEQEHGKELHKQGKDRPCPHGQAPCPGGSRTRGGTVPGQPGVQGLSLIHI